MPAEHWDAVIAGCRARPRPASGRERRPAGGDRPARLRQDTCAKTLLFVLIGDARSFDYGNDTEARSIVRSRPG